MEQLTAYLDGELGADESHAVEQRLREDDSYRDELQRLQKAWDFLDEIPHTSPSSDFTKSTIELVVLDAGKRVRKEKSNANPWWMRAAALIAFPMMGLFGGQYATSYILNAPKRELARDMVLLENFDVYRKADSIEFLELLVEEKIFDKTEYLLNEGSE